MGKPASLLRLPVEWPCSTSSRDPVTSCHPSGKNELARNGCRGWRIGWQGWWQLHPSLLQPHPFAT